MKIDIPGEIDSEVSVVVKKNRFPINVFLTVEFWLVLSCILLSLIVASIMLSNIEPSYKVKTELLIQAPSLQLADQDERKSSRSFYQTQASILRSQALAREVVSDLGLFTRFSETPELLSSHHQSIAYLSGLFTSSDKSLTLPMLNQTTHERFLQRSPSSREQYLTEVLTDSISVDIDKQTNVVEFSFVNIDPSFAAEVVSAYISAYSEFTFNAQIQNIKLAQEWFDNESKGLLRQIENAKRRLSIVVQQEADLQETPNDDEIVVQDESMLRSSKLASLMREFKQKQPGRIDITKVVSTEQLGQNGLIQPVLTEFVNQQKTVDAYFERYREKHPKMIEARANLAEIEARLRPIVGSVLNDYLDGQSNNLDTTSTSNSLSTAFIDDTVSVLEEEVASAIRNYDEFQEQGKTIIQLANYDVPLVKVLNPIDPVSEVKPQAPVVLISAAVLGAFIGLLITAAKLKFARPRKRKRSRSNRQRPRL